jgi:Xaa-Pro aminopeptidase
MLLDLSFDSIAGAGPNAAIPHYHVNPDDCLPLKINEIFLIDSGGQYQDGTRTSPAPSSSVSQPRKCGTASPALKGMIDVCIRFPANLRVVVHDSACQSLWLPGWITITAPATVLAPSSA